MGTQLVIEPQGSSLVFPLSVLADLVRTSRRVLIAARSRNRQVLRRVTSKDER